MDKKEKLRLGIFGHYGNRNLGDEAIIAAVIQSVRNYIQHADIYCFSSHPDDSQLRHQVLSYPIYKLTRKNDIFDRGIVIENKNVSINKEKGSQNFSRQLSITNKFKESLRRLTPVFLLLKLFRNFILLLINFIKELFFLRDSYNILKKIDLLLISGSNQFLDNWGGPFGFPYTLLKWSLLAKITNTRLAFISVGAGPINFKLSLFFIRLAISCSFYTSFRDEPSKKLVEGDKTREIGPVMPDLAFSLYSNNFNGYPVGNKFSKDRPKIGINLMPVYYEGYWPVPDEFKYKNYINKIVEFSSNLLLEDYPVVFFTTQFMDKAVIDDLLEILETKNLLSEQKEDYMFYQDSLTELMSFISSRDIIVATRFHGILLSLLVEKPTLGICYFIKSADLLNKAGQNNYHVNLDNFTTKELMDRFKLLEQNATTEVSKIRKCVKTYQEQLNLQYQTVLFHNS